MIPYGLQVDGEQEKIKGGMPARYVNAVHKIGPCYPVRSALYSRRTISISSGTEVDAASFS